MFLMISVYILHLKENLKLLLKHLNEHLVFAHNAGSVKG